MHILYIYAEVTIKGGTDKMITQKANYLVAHGYDVTILTESQLGRPISFELLPQVRHVDMGLDFNKQYMQSPLRRLITYNRLMRHYKQQLQQTLDRLKPDIVITVMGRSLSLLPQIKGDFIRLGEAHTTKHHLRSLHLMEQRGGLYAVVAKYMRWRMERSVAQLSGLVLLTQRDADEWQEARQRWVIPNPISFYPEKAAELTARQVIMVGRYNDAKGYDYLVAAWQQIHERHPDWTLHAYGSGELHDDVCRWVQEHHVEDSFIMHEPTDNIMEKYLESSICVLSSRYEGFSLVIIEAMACGVPSVSFDSPFGPRTIIHNGVDGLLVDYLNTDALADGVCRLIEDEGLRRKMGEEARRGVLRFSEDSIMHQWMELFDGLVSNRQ